MRDKTFIVLHAFSIPQSLHFSRLSPSPEKEADERKLLYPWYRGHYSPYLFKNSESALCLYKAPWHSVRLKSVQQRSRLHHLFMGIKDIALEMQVNANRLRICFGLLFICWSAFASTLPFLLRGRGQQLLGFWAKTLWRKDKQAGQVKRLVTYYLKKTKKKTIKKHYIKRSLYVINLDHTVYCPTLYTGQLNHLSVGISDAW